ncbi:mannose-6-phosphate isomerase-like protein (cupin superfamily) [Sagittula marina]|uniref:Mannose-6-phosphate isomerase-like protein (Cupin superfamily) n=1 Tax=Sagittula marina TaxID=943940 RepID=A0A7W6DNW7_9RHOB|nr:cupin domain-containing protein [Sagittula marina]MBB3985001.1 mannose-6-phosphate isomerase-like protein (cupin superfamily) [Sagittula marina]
MDDTTPGQDAKTAKASANAPRSSDTIRHPLMDVAARLSREAPFETVFESPEVSIELYAPVGADMQKPHDRDELYIIASGEGTFSRGDELVPFAQGDLLFVPAHVPHRFETFSDDFRTWVIFYGDKRGK